MLRLGTTDFFDMIAGGGPPAEYGAFIAREQSRWKEVVIRGQIKPD